MTSSGPELASGPWEDTRCVWGVSPGREAASCRWDLGVTFLEVLVTASNTEVLRGHTTLTGVSGPQPEAKSRV